MNASPDKSTVDANTRLRWQLLWAAITALSILSFFVLTIQESMVRGESLRKAQRAGNSGPTFAAQGISNASVTLPVTQWAMTGSQR